MKINARIHRKINTYGWIVIGILTIFNIISTLYTRAEIVIATEELRYSINCNADSIFKILAEDAE